MKLFELSLEATIFRFYLMMLVVIVAGFTGFWPLAFLALPIIMSCLWGMKISLRFHGHTVNEAVHNFIAHLRTPEHHTV